uniref:Arginine deiminase n=1 Tax=Trichomonadida sp. LN-2016a TaxID=1812481 RepID=A0A142D9Y7_9EUKA|nr:arginine deiminase [Trichomonadida sp. LN-2016a]
MDDTSTSFSYDKLSIAPLANLTFTRDQQITTAKGLVIGRFGAPQRRTENRLMEHVWNQLGVPIIGTIDPPGCLEGGDFIPLSADVCLLGVGLRTNVEAAQQLMQKDLLGTRRFVIVEDLYDRDQQRMHLDTYFNVVNEHLCVCLDKVMEDDHNFARIAHEYVRTEKGYVLETSMPFGEWLKREKFTVVPATHKQQEGYFINLLHLGKDDNGKDRVFTINPEVERAIKEHGFDGKVFNIDFSPITTMYGGAHCASQVLRQAHK